LFVMGIHSLALASAWPRPWSNTFGDHPHPGDDVPELSAPAELELACQFRLSGQCRSEKVAHSGQPENVSRRAELSPSRAIRQPRARAAQELPKSIASKAGRDRDEFFRPGRSTPTSPR
jgi:hypothetical protein